MLLQVRGYVSRDGRGTGGPLRSKTKAAKKLANMKGETRAWSTSTAMIAGWGAASSRASR